jgi:hypothetical protein
MKSGIKTVIMRIVKMEKIREEKNAEGLIFHRKDSLKKKIYPN